MPICSKYGQENTEVARFCLACGAELAAALEAREERKVVTVRFADLVGFTRRVEQLDPDPAAVCASVGASRASHADGADLRTCAGGGERG